MSGKTAITEFKIAQTHAHEAQFSQKICTVIANKRVKRKFINCKKIPGLFGVDLLYSMNQRSAEPPFPMHRHPKHLELVYIARGSQQYSIAGETYRVGTGELFVTRSSEWHDTAESPTEKNIVYGMLIKETMRQPFLGIYPRDARTLHAALVRLPRHLSIGRQPAEHIKSIFAAPIEQNPLASILLRTKLLDFFMAILTSAAGTGLSTQRESIRRTVSNHIAMNLKNKIPIQNLAGIAGMRVASFRRWFRMNYGVPFHEYVMREKINAIKQHIIHTRQSIIRSAYVYGFSSSNYFATVFKRFTGVSPTTFRRTHMQSSKP